MKPIIYIFSKALLITVLLTIATNASSDEKKNLYSDKEYNPDIDPGKQIDFGSSCSDCRFKNMVFNIPGDCKKFKNFIKEKNPYNNADQATLSMLESGKMACKYENLKNNGNQLAPNDFVSSHDFKNGSLDSLPYAMFCDGGFSVDIASNQEVKRIRKFKKEVCDKLAKENADYSLMDMALLMQKGVWRKKLSDARMKEIVKEVQSMPRDKDCRFKNWKFNNSIKIEDGMVKCPPSEDENSEDQYGFDIYIYRLKFTDFNKDGFLDAIIATNSDGLGSGYRAPTYQVITKKSANQKRFNLIYPSKFSQM